MLRIVAKFIVLFILIHQSAFGSCPMTKQWVFTGDHSTKGFNLNWIGIETPLNEVSTCKTIVGSCGWEYQATENGVTQPGIGSDGCTYQNSADGMGIYSCRSGPIVYVPGGVTPEMLNQITIDYVNDGNATSWGQPWLNRVVQIVGATCSPIYSTFELRSSQELKSSDRNECSNAKISAGEKGSIIDCRSGSLSQAIPVIGTDFTLHYSTTNTTFPATFDIGAVVSLSNPYNPVDGSWNLTSVTVTKEIEGLATPFSHTFPVASIDPVTGATHTFQWDGKDGAGNFVDLPAKVTTKTTYNFATDWNGAPSNMYSEGDHIFGSIDANLDFKMGGWSLSEYHRFLPSVSTVFLGNGLRLKNELNGELVPPVLTNSVYEIPSVDAKTIFTFNSSGLHTKTRNAFTNATIYTFRHDTNGNLTSIVDRDGKTTSIQRDSNGIATSITGPFGAVTNLDYDLAGNLKEIEDNLGRTHKFFYKNAQYNGPMTAYENPMGDTKYYTYDAEGILTSATDEKGGLKALTSSSTGNTDDILDLAEFSSPMGHVTSYQTKRKFNGEVELTNTDPSGFFTTQVNQSLGMKRTFSDTTYDSETLKMRSDVRFGYRVTTDSIERSGTSYGNSQYRESFTLTDPNDIFSIDKFEMKRIEGGFDEFTSILDNATGKITHTNPLGHVFEETLDAKSRVVSERTASLTPIDYSYNSLGQLTAVSQGARSYSLSYDSNGNLASLTDPVSNTFTYSYDAGNRLTSILLPNSNSYLVDYDLNDRTTSITNGNAEEYTYSFDENGNPLLNTEPQIITAFTWEWAYNADDQITKTTFPNSSELDRAYNTDGTLATVSGPSLSRTFSWNQGLLTGVNTGTNVNLSLSSTSLPTQYTWQGAVNGSVYFGYGTFDLLSYVSVNNTLYAYYSYDQAKNLTNVSDLSIVRSVTDGSIASTSQGQVTSTHSYNAFGEEIQASYSKTSGLVVDLGQTRDNIGRIATSTRTVGSTATTTSYTYDSIGQLSTETTGGVTKTYTYDDNGNRFTSGGSESYDVQDRLVSDSIWTYTYDRNGYLTRKDHASNGSYVTYVYDVLGNLLTVQFSNGTKVDYLVDGMERRVRRRLNNAFSAAYIYQDGIRPVAQLNSNGSIKSMFVYGTKVNVPDLMIQGSNTFRIISDSRGSVLYVIRTSNGQIMQQLTYDSWGKVLSDSSPGFQPFGFAGGLYDATTGLVRFGARDYDASIGRWLNKDPIKQGGGINLYTYATNNPLNMVDMNGKKSVGVDEASKALLAAFIRNLKKMPDLYKKFQAIEAKNNALITTVPRSRIAAALGKSDAICTGDAKKQHIIIDANWASLPENISFQALLLHEIFHSGQLADGLTGNLPELPAERIQQQFNSFFGN